MAAICLILEGAESDGIDFVPVSIYWEYLSVYPKNFETLFTFFSYLMFFSISS